MHTDRYGNISGEERHAKGSKQNIIQGFMCRGKRMWGMKCVIVPAIVRATGKVTKGLKRVWN